MTKEKIFLIILLAIVCIFSAIVINNKLSENIDTVLYQKAINLYQTEEYGQAYSQFSKISRFSDLKAAALFRQARCATILGDTQAAIKSYSILLKRYKKSSLYPIAEYNLAVLLYECGSKKDGIEAKKHFNHITNKFKETEVATASKYYLGLINNDALLLLKYIELSPTGRHTQNAIEVLEKFDVKLTKEENFIIAKSNLKREKYESALKYYNKTDLPYSWCGMAKSLYKIGKYQEAKNLTIKGLKDYTTFVDTKELYEVIDCFISLSNNKLQTINFLLSINPKSKVSDYLLYLSAKNSPSIDSTKIYETLYSKYPNGQFSAEALYKIFYSKINKNKYDDAIKLGRIHLTKFSNTNSAPAVMFWMGKIYEKKHMPDTAKSYYKSVISNYPDTYYAMRANAKLNPNISMFEKNKITPKPIEFPVKKKTETNLALKLAKLGDYDFVKELYKDDEFVESWIEYNKGNYTLSTIIARDAMDKLDIKPDFKDTRWRLVYPIHYYKIIQKYANKENPIIILSIIKEESHFNPNIVSCVGACGLMQLMPATANEIAIAYGLSNNLFIPENNIHLGSLYYTKIKNILNNKDMSAIMAYNGGWGAVSKWKNDLNYSDIDDFVEKIPYPETQEYLKKVMRTYWNYTKIY